MVRFVFNKIKIWSLFYILFEQRVMIRLYCVIVRESVPEPAATNWGSPEEGEKVAASGEVLDLNNERNESEYGSASQPIGLLDIPLATLVTS
jgi:hypothetical protein